MSDGYNREYPVPAGPPFGMGKEGLIFQKLPELAVQIGAVTKSKERPAGYGEGGYVFRGIDDILNACGPAFAVCGLCASLEILSNASNTLNVVTSGGKDKVMHVAEVKLRVTLIAADGSWVRAEGFGKGSDYGDGTCAAKAQSMAFKYAMTLGLRIPVDPHALDDADQDEHPEGSDYARTATKADVPINRPGDKKSEELVGVARKAIMSAYEKYDLTLLSEMSGRVMSNANFTAEQQKELTALISKLSADVRKAKETNQPAPKTNPKNGGSK